MHSVARPAAADGGHLAFPAAAMEHAPVAMAVVEGPEYRCIGANAAFRALPLAAEPAPGARLTDCLPASALNACLPHLEEARHSGRPARIADVAAGAGTVLDIDMVPLPGPDGAMLLTVHDVSTRVAALAEKDMLLREVSHRAKNSLQLVSSLLTLQALSVPDGELRRNLQSAGGRIGTVAQVHQRLHAHDQYHAVAFGRYLRDLCRDLTGSLASSTGRVVAVDTDDVDLPIDSVIPLALVVNELVSNAVKHAYADGQPGDVEVQFRVLPDGQKRLTVADHGRGLPDGFDVARAGTLGMKVVRAFAGQLKGRIRGEANQPGTRFVLELPA